MALFIWEKLPMEIVSLGALLLLLVVPFDGHPILIPPGKTEQTQVLGSIFGNNAVLVVAFMFIVGAAVERTGLVDDLGHWFERIAGRSVSTRKAESGQPSKLPINSTHAPANRARAPIRIAR